MTTMNKLKAYEDGLRKWKERGGIEGLGGQWNPTERKYTKAAEPQPGDFELSSGIELKFAAIARMRVLNSEQQRRNQENHVCPLQIDIVDRLIERYSNKGEVVFDPFAGIFTVPYRAIHMGRIGWGSELSAEYWRCGVGYCEQAELEHHAPTLFDMADSGMEVVAK